MTSFPALTLLIGKNTLVHIIKRKLHGGLKIRILFSRGKKQYFTQSLRSFVKYCFHHSRIKFISSRRRVISSIYFFLGHKLYRLFVPRGSQDLLLCKL